MSPKDRVPKRKDGQPRENAIEADERFADFSRYYVELHGNGLRAALAAGYPEDYARSHAHLLVARLKLKTQPVLRRYGLDEVFVARKLKKLASAKEPKWNQQTKEWDKFENAAVQIKAVELVKDLLGMDPPKRIAGDGPGGAIPIVLRHSIPRPSQA